jgi:aspartate aminotransferase
MRSALVNALKEIDCPPPSSLFTDWSHVTSQIGMFAYTGLNEDMCDKITAKHHIYCTRNGRFSMAGVTPSNVAMIAAAIKDVIVG